MGKGLDLSALVVILSLIFWGFILGPVGMFLATPFTLTIKIIMDKTRKHDGSPFFWVHPPKLKPIFITRNRTIFNNTNTQF
jgi:predicted PurR-regulated permease PerM